MKNLLFIISFCFTNILLAQSVNFVEGKILDRSNNDEPIMFANITVKGSRLKTISDYKGNYILKGLEKGTYTLQYSFLGYKTEEVEITTTGTKNNMDIFLEASKAINFEAIQFAANNE